MDYFSNSIFVHFVRTGKYQMKERHVVHREYLDINDPLANSFMFASHGEM